MTPLNQYQIPKSQKLGSEAWKPLMQSLAIPREHNQGYTTRLWYFHLTSISKCYFQYAPNASKVFTLVTTNPRNNDTLKSMSNSQIPKTRFRAVETSIFHSWATMVNLACNWFLHAIDWQQIISHHREGLSWLGIGVFHTLGGKTLKFKSLAQLCQAEGKNTEHQYSGVPCKTELHPPS